MKKATRSPQPPSITPRRRRNIPASTRNIRANVPSSTQNIRANKPASTVEASRQQEKMKYLGGKSVFLCCIFAKDLKLSAIYEVKIQTDGVVNGKEGGTISISRDLDLFDPNDDLETMAGFSCACLGTQLYTLVNELPIKLSPDLKISLILERAQRFGKEGKPMELLKSDPRWHEALTPSIDTFVLDFDLLERSFTKEKRMTSTKNCVTAIAACGKIFALEAGVSELSHMGDIPNPGFESFDPKTNQWESLPNAPFHDYNFKPQPDIEGYAVVHNYILISLSVRKEFYSYDIVKKEWRPVLKVDGDGDDNMGYKQFLGKAEFLDGKIFAHLWGNMVAYSVIFLDPPQDGNDPVVGLRAPIKLEGFEIPQPTFLMGFFPSYCLTYLGNKVFCAVQTAVDSFTTKTIDSQPLYISIFRVINSEDEQQGENSMRIETLHSTTRIISHKGRGAASVTDCFSLFDMHNTSHRISQPKEALCLMN